MTQLSDQDFEIGIEKSSKHFTVLSISSSGEAFLILF